MTLSEWEAGIASLLPPEDLKALSDDTLDSVFGYLNNQSDSASISLQILKTRLAGPQGMELVSRILNAQPDCTLEQLLQMGMGFVSGDVSLCKPPEEMLGLVTPLIETELRFLTGAIPDEVVLISAESGNLQGDPRLRLNRARTIMKFSPLLPIVLLAALTASCGAQSHRLAQVVGLSLPRHRCDQRSCRPDRLANPRFWPFKPR
jgi:hypothetical protein